MLQIRARPRCQLRREAVMTPRDAVSIFRRFEILEDLPSAVLEDLARSCSWRPVQAGQHILIAREESAEVYFIASGKVRILLYSAAEGRPVLFTILGPYQMFGEVAAIDRCARSASVEAEEDCLLAVLPHEPFCRLMREHHAFALAVMKQLASQVRRLSERVFEFSTLGVQSRIYSELLRCAVPVAGKTGQGLLSPAPHRSDLAARVSTNREAVSRAITVLKRKGIIRKEGKDFRILNLETLRDLVMKAKGE
jgi:CRP/FNR family transcriptional regulator, cyclic AMP receptor protein